MWRLFRTELSYNKKCLALLFVIAPFFLVYEMFRVEQGIITIVPFMIFLPLNCIHAARLKEKRDRLKDIYLFPEEG